ncbi:MAG TPA: alpha/beta hydrolase [Nocardioides sp.]|nr:alpha/beta hydrolase [Nocardioides sp.]
MAHPDTPALVRHLVARFEAAAFSVLMGLPESVQRAAAGRPVILDGQVLDTETQFMLRLQQLLREPSAETLPIHQGRAAILRQAMLAGGRQRVGAVHELEVPGADGPLAARLYVPRSQVSTGSPAARTGPTGATGATGAPASPLLFFVHGGGMMYGDLDSHDAACRFLTERADVRVLAVDYRLAPEHKFPAAVEDCWTAYQWVAENAEELGADPERIAVGGDSAGGYLSAVVALKAAEAGVPCAFQLLVYPVTNMVEQSESRRMFGEGFFLTTDFTELATEMYFIDEADRHDPLASIAFTEKIPENLAPAYVATAGFDPLRDEGEAWARRLADSGVDVTLRRFPGLIHGFLNVVGVGRSQRAAVAEIAARLKAALHT